MFQGKTQLINTLYKSKAMLWKDLQRNHLHKNKIKAAEFLVFMIYHFNSLCEHPLKARDFRLSITTNINT